MKKMNADRYIQVMCWVKTGYRKQSRALFTAQGIIKEFKYSTRFRLLNGDIMSVKHKDIISIETVAAE